MSELAPIVGVTPSTLLQRARSGWTPDNLLAPANKHSSATADFAGKFEHHRYTIDDAEADSIMRKVQRNLVGGTFYPRQAVRDKWLGPKELRRRKGAAPRKLVRIAGVTMSIKEFSSIFGVPRHAVDGRVNGCGWSLIHAVTVPVNYKPGRGADTIPIRGWHSRKAIAKWLESLQLAAQTTPEAEIALDK